MITWTHGDAILLTAPAPAPVNDVDLLEDPAPADLHVCRSCAGSGVRLFAYDPADPASIDVGDCRECAGTGVLAPLGGAA